MSKRKGNRIDAQAAALANASLPSIAGINRQYGRAAQDNQGFTQALLGELKGIGSGSQAYDSAVSQQHMIDQAAQNQLSGLGGTGGGAAAAIGGLTGSGLSDLLAGQAAQSTYAHSQPIIAALRGHANAVALEQQRIEDLKQRQEQYAQAYPAARVQLGQQAFQNNLATQQLQLSRQNAAESQREFNASQQQQWNEFLLGLHAKAKTASGAAKWTPSQISGFKDDAASTVEQAIGGVHNPNFDPSQAESKTNPKFLISPNAVSPSAVFKHMTTHGIPRFVALQTMQNMYGPGVFATFLQRTLPLVYRRLYPGQSGAAGTGSIIAGAVGNVAQ